MDLCYSCLEQGGLSCDVWQVIDKDTADDELSLHAASSNSSNLQ